MRLVVVCFAALCCCSCSGVHRNDLAAQAAAGEATKPVYGQPAGYYAGRADPELTSVPELNAWLARNQRGIDEIQRRISQIRNGERAPGCLGEDKFNCVATVAQKLAVADSYRRVAENIFAEVKYDVNGKPINGAKVKFGGSPANAAPRREAVAGFDAYNDYSAAIEARQNTTQFILNLGPRDTVVSILAKLPKLTPLARTQEDYDKTGIYEVVWAASVKTCPALRPDEVAKWIENTVKPTSRITAKERLNDEVTAQDLVSNAASFCGHKYVFHTIKQKERQGLGHTTTFETIVAIDWNGRADGRGAEALPMQKYF
jgi:hypothetical protein